MKLLNAFVAYEKDPDVKLLIVKVLNSQQLGNERGTLH